MRTESTIDRLREQIKDIKIAMLTTVDDDGDLRSRPMATLEVEDDGDLWFFTRIDSPKVEETEREHRVNVAYAAPSANRYVSVSGRAELVYDRARINKLWRPEFRLYFPEGRDDPSLVMLRVTPHAAEYWCAPATSIGRALHFVKTMLAGERPQVGQHAKLAF
jgi:general stress protein 26